MKPRHPRLEFINSDGEIASNNLEIVAFLRYQHVGRLCWDWSLRTVTLVPRRHDDRRRAIEYAPSVGNLIAFGHGMTKTNALCRAQTALTTYLHERDTNR
jgi:hypothetical protein